MSTIDKLGRNLQFSAYCNVLVIFNSFFLTPFILRYVDLELYGLNALILSVVGYFNILDLGFNSGISRFTALFFGKGEEDKLFEILRFGIKVFIILGVVVAATLFILSFFYEKLFHIESKLINQGRILLLIYAASSLFSWVILPFRGTLRGIQRMDISEKIGLSISLLNIPIAIIVLKYYGSFLLFIGVFQFVTIILSFLNIIFTLRLLPKFRFNLLPIRKSLKNEISAFSSGYFAAGILNIIIFQVNYFIIGTIIGVSAVAIYAIALNIHNSIRGLNSLIANPIYYAITAEYEKHPKEAQDSMIIKATMLHTGILIPILIIVIISADNFILTWVGERFAGAIFPCKILLSYWFFNIMSEILSHGAVGAKGRVDEIVKLQSFVAITNLGLSLMLIRFMGITGVALGAAIPWILAANFFIYRFCKILSIPVWDFILRGILPNLPHFLFAIVMSIIAQKFMRNGNIFQIIIMMGIIYSLTLIVGYSLLSIQNKRLIKRLIVLRA